MTGEPQEPMNRRYDLDGIRRMAASEIASLEKTIRFDLLSYVHALVSNLWDCDHSARGMQEGELPFFLGHYGSFEGLADAGQEKRSSIVLTLAKNKDVENSHGHMLEPSELLYLILPVEEDLLVKPKGSIPYINEVFIVEVKPHKKHPLISYKQVTNTGVYTYAPLQDGMQDLADLMKDPAIMSKFGERNFDPAYTLRIFNELVEEFQPVAHSELDPKHRVVSYTGDYFAPIG